jgi:ubiquinone/menaquinone biosynthesis C-methylase UbiE
VNCDGIARWYRWIEYAAFGGALMRRRLAFLSEVADARRALVVGEGDGRFLVKLVEQNRNAAIEYLDLSPRMLELARRRVGEAPVVYHQGDARTVPVPDATFDLIVTHFFLDCFDDTGAAEVVSRLASAATPNARWLISEFRQPTHGLPGMWASLWLAAMYRFFGITTGLRTRKLTNHRPLLEAQGFRLVREETAWVGLLGSELWQR